MHRCRIGPGACRAARSAASPRVDEPRIPRPIVLRPALAGRGRYVRIFKPEETAHAAAPAGTNIGRPRPGGRMAFIEGVALPGKVAADGPVED